MVSAAGSPTPESGGSTPSTPAKMEDDMEIRDNPLTSISFHFEDGGALQWKPGSPIPQLEVMRSWGELADRVGLPIDIKLEDVPEYLTDMDRHMLYLALMAVCAHPDGEPTDEFRENVRHVARAVGVHDDKLEAVISL